MEKIFGTATGRTCIGIIELKKATDISKKITIADIKLRYKKYVNGRRKNDFNAKFNLWGEHVLRKVSYYPTWVFLRLGISANQITGLGFVIGVLGCILLALGNNRSIITGALLLNIWAILDYVDGQVARCNDSNSNYGKFLDFITENVIAILLFTFAGIGAYTQPDPWLNLFFQSFLKISVDKSIFLILGGWASVFYIFPLFVGYQSERFGIRDFVNFTDQLKVEGLPKNFVQIIGFNLFNITGLIMPTLLIATLLEFLTVVLFLWALIHTFGSAYMALNMANEARLKSLSYGRKNS